jgi:hypothetical protein
MKDFLLNFLTDYWPAISLIIYELCARLFPTSKNLSLLDGGLKLSGEILKLTKKGADTLIPNREKNTLKVITIILLCFSSLFASAQLNGNFKTVKYTSNVAAADTTTLAANGQTYFNHTTQKFRIRINGAWENVSSSSGILTANNGLNLTGSNVQLGGALLANTTLSGAFDLYLANLTTTFRTNSLRIYNPAETFHYSIATGALTTNRTLNIPNISADANFVLSSAAGLTNAVPFWSTSTNLTRVSDLTYTQGTMTLSTPNSIVTATEVVGGSTITAGSVVLDVQSTTRGLGLPRVTNAAAIVTPFNGMIAYNAATDRAIIRESGAWQNVTGGITNTAIANEIPKSDGTNIIPSGIFSTTLGDVNFGTGLAGADRIVQADGSAINVGFDFRVKGTRSMTFRLSPSSDFVSFDASTGVVMQATNPSYTFGGTGTASLNAGILDLEILTSDKTGITNGNDISVITGDVVDGNAGDIILAPGNSTGTGTPGLLKLSDGANRNMGIATLVGGTITVNNILISANTRIFYSVETAGGTQGFLSTTRVAANSFTINSTSGTDTSTIVWLLIEPN